MPLLPPNKDLGWTPYAWLIYLGFFFVQPVLSRAGWGERLATALGTAVFLTLYFAGYWLKGRQCLWVVAAIALLGVGFAPFNSGASVFFVYAAAFVGYTGDSGFAVKILALLLAVIGLESLALHLPADFWFFAAILSPIIGGVNIHFVQRTQANVRLRMAHDEIEHLAKVAERERIARDLHDVLGHTLSVVILKSELASKLIGHDAERAASEIRDVERISRAALAEVRTAIGGYRTGGLAEELVRAQATLQTASVAVDCRAALVVLSPAQETVLALALREAVTNVVRHAHARSCRLRLEQVNRSCQLQIQDDGRGGFQNEGNGLRGMRERIEALGGTLLRETNAGTGLIITLPLDAENRNGQGRVNNDE